MLKKGFSRKTIWDGFTRCVISTTILFAHQLYVNIYEGTYVKMGCNAIIKMCIYEAMNYIQIFLCICECIL